MNNSKVYFTKELTGKALIKIYEALSKELKGKVAVKIHSGELGGHNFIKPEMMKELIQKLNGVIVECNTAYHGKRFDTKDHFETIKTHGFDKIAPVDIMDSDGDYKLEIENGKHLKYNLVGKHLLNYNSLLVLSHFKGHQMGGFGGALKNMSIGIASRNGKATIHSAGVTDNPENMWKNLPQQNDFLESMAEADKSIVKYFNNEICYINVAMNLSVDCDCNANPEAPCMKDIGIFASLDPVALDSACLNAVINSNDPGKEHFLERVNSRNGAYILEYAEKIGLGSKEYELIEI